jgi:hypothetical protein
MTIISELRNNSLFDNFSEITMFALVFENMHSETYYPGELIMPMDQRSKLNKNMFPFYKDRYSDFFMIIDQRKKDARDGTKTRQAGAAPSSPSPLL